jgi:LPXTG-site transpeptidase (sortase) family protein
VTVLLLGGSLAGVGAGRMARAFHAERSLAGLDRNAGAFDTSRHDRPEPAVFAATSDVPTETPPALAAPAGLSIPAIGLDAPVIPIGVREENGELVWETADHAVGYHLGTALPGRPGNTVLSGHISSPVRGEGDVFRNLPQVEPGDAVIVTTGDGRTFRYLVDATTVVEPTDTWVMSPTTDQTLTLITCVPDGVYTHRFVARAVRVPDTVEGRGR